MDNVIKNVNKYFTDGSLKVFEVLLPEKLPKRQPDIQTYGNNEVAQLSRRFNIAMLQRQPMNGAIFCDKY